MNPPKRAYEKLAEESCFKWVTSGQAISLIKLSVPGIFEDGFKVGFEAAIEMLRSKTAQGWELDEGLRSGDSERMADWLERTEE